MPTSINNLGTALGGTSSTQNSNSNTNNSGQSTYREVVILMPSHAAAANASGASGNGEEAPVDSGEVWIVHGQKNPPETGEVIIIRGQIPVKDHLYNGNTGAEENSERNRLWAESSYKERVEAQGLSFSKMVDEGNGLKPIKNEITKEFTEKEKLAFDALMNQIKEMYKSDDERVDALYQMVKELIGLKTEGRWFGTAMKLLGLTPEKPSDAINALREFGVKLYLHIRDIYNGPRFDKFNGLE